MVTKFAEHGDDAAYAALNTIAETAEDLAWCSLREITHRFLKLACDEINGMWESLRSPLH